MTATTKTSGGFINKRGVWQVPFGKCVNRQDSSMPDQHGRQTEGAKQAADHAFVEALQPAPTQTLHAAEGHPGEREHPAQRGHSQHKTQSPDSWPAKGHRRQINRQKQLAGRKRERKK